MFNPCEDTDAGQNIDCVAAVDDVCLDDFDDAFDEDGYPLSLANQIYPPIRAIFYVKYDSSNDQSKVYWPGTASNPNSPSIAPDLVYHDFIPDGSNEAKRHYFINIKKTSNHPQRAPGEGGNWREYWEFACSRCQEAFCRDDIIECEPIGSDGGARVSPNGVPICSETCSDAGLFANDAAGLKSCYPNLPQ